jgi:hypothetical protein
VPVDDNSEKRLQQVFEKNLRPISEEDKNNNIGLHFLWGEKFVPSLKLCDQIGILTADDCVTFASNLRHIFVTFALLFHQLSRQRGVEIDGAKFFDDFPGIGITALK